ncbi:hypothetical protein V5799_018218 [Amblyomma americanum]|uniref:Uncharacterized protein n=1 Tax=Amblyomma americanum TaxID=6943 RepID=A0AAQ4F0E2_AMBAM
MNHSGGADVGEDDEFDASYKTCAAASGKHSRSMEGSSGNYASAEPHDATEQVWSCRRDCSNIEKHWGLNSPTLSDETIGPGQSWLQEVCSEEVFRTANSRSTDENEGKCHRAHQMGYGGGRFVQKSVEVGRKFASGAGLHGVIEESSFGDESPSLAKESQSW